MSNERRTPASARLACLRNLGDLVRVVAVACALAAVAKEMLAGRAPSPEATAIILAVLATYLQWPPRLR